MGKKLAEKAMVLGFAYGFRKNGAGRSNNSLIKALMRQRKIFKLPLILQDDLAFCPEMRNEDYGNLAYVIRSSELEKYVDTDAIAKQGIEAAIELGCTTIYVLAYPILHRQLCWFITRRMAKPYGIKVKVFRTGWIPSDPLSEQWWTRNPFYPFIYTALRVLFNRRGK